MKKALFLGLGVLVVVAGAMMAFLLVGQGAILEMDIADVAISDISDATYRGSFESGRWSNEVEVTVKDQRMTSIIVTRDVLFRRDEVSQELFDRMIEAQSVVVDAVSGATVTSRAYMKAVEDALTQD